MQHGDAFQASSPKTYQGRPHAGPFFVCRVQPGALDGSRVDNGDVPLSSKQLTTLRPKGSSHALDLGIADLTFLLCHQPIAQIVTFVLNLTFHRRPDQSRGSTVTIPVLLDRYRRPGRDMRSRCLPFCLEHRQQRLQFLA